MKIVLTCKVEKSKENECLECNEWYYLIIIIVLKVI